MTNEHWARWQPLLPPNITFTPPLLLIPAGTTAGIVVFDIAMPVESAPDSESIDALAAG